MPKQSSRFVLKVWRVTFSLACVAVCLAGNLNADPGWVARSPQSKARSRVAWPADSRPTAAVQIQGSDPANFRTEVNGGANYGPILEPEMNPGQGPTTIVPPQGVPFAGPVGNGNDYWIVSSRKCKNRDRNSGTNCCLSFFHSPQPQQLMPVDRQAFLGTINPAVPVCFVIHGSYNRWGDVTRESRRIYNWIRTGCNGAPLQVVFFTWPSDGNMPFIFPVDIAVLGRRSSLHGPYLAQLIAELPPDVRVSLIGHSHGARVAVSALHILGGGQVEDGRRLAGPATPHRIRATLLAPALDHHWLNPGERYGQAMCAVERMLLMRNQSDATMAMYVLRKPFAEPALGYRGPNMFDRMMLDGQNEKLVEMDVSDSVRIHHAWASYCQRPELASAVAPFTCFCDEGQPQPADTYTPQTIQLGPTPVGPTPAGPSQGQPTPVETPPTEPKRVLSGPANKPQRVPLPLAVPTERYELPEAPAPAARLNPQPARKMRIEPTYVAPLPSRTSRLPTIDDKGITAVPPPASGKPPVRIELDEASGQSNEPLPLLVE